MIFILIGPSMDSGDYDSAPDSACENVDPTDAIKDTTIASDTADETNTIDATSTGTVNKSNYRTTCSGFKGFMGQW